MAVKAKNGVAQAVAQRVAEKAMREGLSLWLEGLAHEKLSRRIAGRADLLAFLGEPPHDLLRVVLKNSLKCESGFIAPAETTDREFLLFDDAAGRSNPRAIKYADVALYQLPGSGRVATS